MLNSVAIIVYTFAIASVNLYDVCDDENVDSVKFGFTVVSSICKGFICLLVVANFAAQIFLKRFTVASKVLHNATGLSKLYLVLGQLNYGSDILVNSKMLRF